jgi:hypothetical protein
MRMRKGNGGTDMFRQCRVLGVAAITYEPLENTDLTPFAEFDPPDAWGSLAPAQSGNLRNFAWRIRGGDLIYVAESYPSRIVAVGRVKGELNARAYRFVADTKIVDDDERPWRHVVDVEWEHDNLNVRYRNPWAAQIAVLELGQKEVSKIRKLLKRGLAESLGPSDDASAQSDSKPPDDDESIRLRQLEESSYTRYSTNALRVIDRRHVKLCNEFTSWMYSQKQILCRIERRSIDVQFVIGKQNVLVEFKIAYRSDPKPAIREALGQILEYNHYPGRTLHDHWILMLYCVPTRRDHAFIAELRKYGLPLSLGWKASNGFHFSEGCVIQA